jgi:hypothetical protein
MIRKLTTTVTLVTFGFLTHCTADPATDDAQGSADSALSSSIHDHYGITMFGGAGDFQKMACGLSSHAAQTSNPYYVASSQRYGCKVHLKLTTSSGRCVVVSTEDAGPATWVETKAGTPILDASPATVKKLFPGAEVDGLGWVDLRKNPGTYSVTAVKTSLPLGPCNAAPAPPPPPSPAPTQPVPVPTTEPPADPGTPPVDPGTPAPDPAPGPACSGDGACNPGSNGSGQICQNGHCIAGCRTNAQCPGATTCVGGQCQ